MAKVAVKIGEGSNKPVDGNEVSVEVKDGVVTMDDHKDKPAKKRTRTAKPTLSNMALWDQVCETNPADTKNFKGKGGFQGTAICAQSQKRKATEMFGIYGIGWRVEEEFYETILLDPSDPHTGRLLYRAKLTFNFEGKGGWILLASDLELFSYSTKWKQWSTGNDLQKKVRTDALTKGLSDLGFNADVFEGNFDDNKYIAEMKEKYKDDPTPKAPDAKKPEVSGRNNATSNTGNNGTPAVKAKPAPQKVAETVKTETPQQVESELPLSAGVEDNGIDFPKYAVDDLGSMFTAAVSVVNQATKYKIDPSHIVTIMGLASVLKRKNDPLEMAQLMGSLKMYLAQNPEERKATMAIFATKAKA